LLEIHEQHAKLVELMRGFGPMRERSLKFDKAAEGRQRGLFD
jgi:hypothetical protein